ncbi:MAG: choice-of-anchor U domain-containing protein [Desulfobacteraceae bacterium]
MKNNSSAWKMFFLGALVSVCLIPTVVLAAAPVVDISMPVATDGSFTADAGDSITFSGSAADDVDGDDIVSYRWSSNKDGVLSEEKSFTLSSLSEGEHTITLLATDAGNEDGFASVTVTIIRIKPTVSITAPEVNSQYDYHDPLQTSGGSDVAFTCDASDEQDDASGPDDGDINLSWSSSIDNAFGTARDDGAGAAVTPVTLSSGTHTITVTATDSDGNTSTDSITITINSIPPEDVAILFPSEGDSFGYGELITFQGSAVAPEEGSLKGDSLVWTSSQGDAMGTGETLAVDTFSSGTHVVTLTATDSKGLSTSATVTITVGNAPPTAEITAPEDGSLYDYRQDIIFSGTGSDPEDGALSGSSLVWTRTTLGTTVEIGTGPTVSVNDFPSGTHVVTLTVTDQDEEDPASDDTSITITVGNASPATTITAPADGSSHAFGSSIALSGEGIDPEDGSLTGDALSWSSDKDGFLGTGASISKSDLSVNTHVITLTATDSESAATTASITISVGDEPPPAENLSIATPLDGDLFYLDTYINFQGSATDKEDGELTGSSLEWTTDQKEETIGTGTNFSVKDLTKGEHLITLTATDSSGASVSTFIVIEVQNRLPVPVITAPEEGSQFDQGEEIQFRADVTDPEDGQVTGSSLVWQSDIDGMIGTGIHAADKLSAGIHTITLTARDSNEGVKEESITVTVNPTGQGTSLALEKQALLMPLDVEETITITNGVPPYRVETGFPDIVDASVQGSTLTISPNKTGNTSVMVIDHNEHEISLSIEVVPESGEFPVASAGEELSVLEFETVTLDGSASLPGIYGVDSWSWEQTGGSRVVLSSSSEEKVTFVAPPADDPVTLTFQLTVTDGNDYESSDQVSVTVSDNGIERYNDLTSTFRSADGSKDLGINVVGAGELVLLQASHSEFIGDDYNRPENMIYDLIDFKIKVDDAGDRANVIIYLPDPLEQDVGVYKYSETEGWYDVTGNVRFDEAQRDKVYLSLEDGGPYDDDGMADGIISDPLTFGSAPSESSDSDEDAGGDSGGGGGGGCFISIIKG